MKSFIVTIAFLLNLTALMSQGQKEAISGLWLNHDGNSVIEIYEENNVFHGRVHEILRFPENKTEEYTKEQLERGKEKMKGRLILTDLRFKNGKWNNGKILDPKDNTTKASCSITLSESNENLKLKIKKGFFSTTKIWSRYGNKSSANVD